MSIRGRIAHLVTGRHWTEPAPVAPVLDAQSREIERLKVRLAAYECRDARLCAENRERVQLIGALVLERTQIKNEIARLQAEAAQRERLIATLLLQTDSAPTAARVELWEMTRGGVC